MRGGLVRGIMRRKLKANGEFKRGSLKKYGGYEEEIWVYGDYEEEDWSQNGL